MRVLSKGAMAGLVFLLPACLAGQTRIFITDSNSWQVSGGFGANVETSFGSHSGGARPQTVELIKTFGERCHTVTVTIDRNKADYVILFDREGGKGYAHKRDKIAVFKKDGDILYSGSTRSLGNAVKDACSAIERTAALK